MPSPSWDDLKLIEVRPSGAFFRGEHEGRAASIVRLVPAARDRVRARLAKLDGVAPSRRVLGQGLDDEPPWVAEEAPASTLAERPVTTGAAARAIASELASALVTAHALGVAHGALSLGAVGLDAAGRATISLLGLDASRTARPAEDAFALGGVLREMIAGVEPGADRDVLSRWAERLSEPDPSRRPSVAAFQRALADSAPAEEPRGPADEGETAGGIDAHPPAPATDRPTVVRRFEWQLRAKPEVLWRFVSNTERVNRALGLAPMEQEIVVDPATGEPEIRGRSSQVGFELRWRERPYEWVTGHRLGVVREYETGPIRWLRSTIALLPGDGGGTHLVQILEAEPRNVLARAVVAVELGVRMKRAFDRVYARIDEVLSGRVARKGRIEADAFEPVDAPTGAVAAMIEDRESWMLARHPEAADAISALADAIRFSPAPELARLQPIALARRLGVDEEQMITACFAGVKAKLLTAGWDLLCPSCRAPSGFAEALEALKAHGRCEACAMDYDLDLTSSVELVFEPHPSVRAADEATYCLSSPAHAPYVAAQVILGAGERLALPPILSPGAWLIARRGAAPIELAVREGPGRVEVPLSLEGASLAAGRGVLVIHNDTPRAARVRVETASRRADVLTAARAVAHPLFEQVFPGDTLAPGVRVTASTMTFVVTGKDGGDVLAHYDDPIRALAIALTAAHAEGRVSMELGAAVATARGGRIAYEGEPISRARENLPRAKEKDIVMGPRLASHELVVDLTHQLEHEGALSLVGSAGPSGIRYRAS